MRYFILTQQYNEDYLLPIFLKHYRQYLNAEDIKIIDHGSTIPIPTAGYDRIYIPRNKPFSEFDRLHSMRHIAASLLFSYDFGIIVDIDELINLSALPQLEFTHKEVYYVTGFEVFYRQTEQGRRLRGFWNPNMSKPSVFKDLPNWDLGFHRCDQPIVNFSLPMAHIRYLNPDRAKNRLNLRNEIHQEMLDLERNSGVNLHWQRGMQNLSNFYEYVNLTNFTCENLNQNYLNKLYERFMSDPTSLDFHYKKLPIEFDLTDYFPQLIDLEE